MTTGECAYWACVLEATTRKPGNVHPGCDFPDMTYQDFLTSAAAIAPLLNESRGSPIGLTVLRCIEASKRVVSTNTNLGIVLLLAPLAVGDNIVETLNNTTIDDAIHVYEAIRLARPGGMGQASEQDIAAEPTVNLRQAMALAQDRDSIARQYINNFADVFDGAAQLSDLRKRQSLNTPLISCAAPSAGANTHIYADIVKLYLWFLARLPDSLVGRKRGASEAQQLQSLAQATLDDPARLPELESWFAAAFPHRNPGTTADLVCASLFVALRQGIITLPELSDHA